MDNTMWEKLKKGLRDGASISMEKMEYTKIGKLKLDELAARRKIDRNFADIGQAVFDLVDEDRAGEIENAVSVKKAVENIRTLRKELVEIRAKIDEIQEEVRKGREDRANTEENMAEV